MDASGEATGFCMPNGEPASAEQMKDDCEAWSTSFARDQRACFIQNHDHDCTGTCVKYQKKKNAAEVPQRAGQKIAGPGVPKCRFRYFRYVALLIGGMLKYVVRRGRELVKRVSIATGNEKTSAAKLLCRGRHPSGLPLETWCNQRSVATPIINTRREPCRTCR